MPIFGDGTEAGVAIGHQRPIISDVLVEKKVESLSEVELGTFTKYDRPYNYGAGLPPPPLLSLLLVFCDPRVGFRSRIC